MHLEQVKNRSDHTSSSRPSSAKEFHEPIQNNRERSGRHPGAQPGHLHHGRKLREKTDRRIELEVPGGVRENPEDWEPTGRIRVKQKVELIVREYMEEYVSREFRNIHTGRKIRSEWPEGLGKDEVNYGPAYKAAILYLTHECNLPARKACDFH